MKVLVAIPHYYRFEGGPPDSPGMSQDRAARVHCLGMCISGLHRLFGGTQTKASVTQPEHRAANQAVRAEVHVIVATCQNRHVLGDLSAIRTAFEHHETRSAPLELGLECHALLRDRLGAYDYYCYMEDDLVLHDPWFFIKLRYFAQQAGNDALLQPNRFEFSRGSEPVKMYIDGELPIGLTARFQDTRRLPEVVLPIMGAMVAFQRTLNPHSGCFFLNSVQMDHWVRQPCFLDRDAGFIGPLQSAATLGVMRTFRIYKPAVEYASFLEIQRWGDGCIRRLAQRHAHAQREGQHDGTLRGLAARLQKLGQGEEAVRLYEQALAERPSAELRAEFRRLTVLTRHWEGRSATAPEDRLLFDGTHYYCYDLEGNRTSRYQKDAQGNRFDLTSYDWDDRNRLVAVRPWDASGRCTEKVENASEPCGPRAEGDSGAAGGEEDRPYDGRNLFCEPNSEGTVGKVAFVSPHCVIDFTNGAATATLDGLALLAQSGFECQAFCGTRFDAWEELLVEESLARLGLRYEVRNSRIGAHRGRLIFTRHGKVAVTLFNMASTRGACSSDEETAALLAACDSFLVKNRPDVVWTYGGDPVSCAVQQLVKGLHIPILIALHNFRYGDLEPFRMVDRVIVPTQFAQRHYREKLGLTCDLLPLVVDPERVSVERCPRPNPLPEGEGNFVTFVNPEPRKGIHVFARIAEVLSQRRADIPMLMVEGAVKASFLPELGIDLSGAKNLRIMPNTPDARQFLAATKILLMPSLMENAALVAMEAMLNGIPVLASNRGGLPETIGDAGFLFDIPAKYTPETREVPTAEEVEPWVETIIRLWDDAAEYERWSQAARNRSQRWHPDHVGPIYREFFSSITHQPGPPPTMGTWCPPQWVTGQASPAVMSDSTVVVANRDQMIMKFPRDAVVAEIGVDQGVFSRSILRTNPRRLHLIDPWEKQTGDFANDPMNDGDFEQKYKTVRETLGRLPNVEIIRDYSLKAVERFADGYFDWIYLDADHSYRAVRSDLEAWIRKIRPGGIFAGHDYCTRHWIQVKAALDDFLCTIGRRLDFLTSDDVFLSWGFIV